MIKHIAILIIEQEKQSFKIWSLKNQSLKKLKSKSSSLKTCLEFKAQASINPKCWMNHNIVGLSLKKKIKVWSLKKSKSKRFKVRKCLSLKFSVYDSNKWRSNVMNGQQFKTNKVKIIQSGKPQLFRNDMIGENRKSYCSYPREQRRAWNFISLMTKQKIYKHEIFRWEGIFSLPIWKSQQKAH